MILLIQNTNSSLILKFILLISFKVGTEKTYGHKCVSNITCYVGSGVNLDIAYCTWMVQHYRLAQVEVLKSHNALYQDIWTWNLITSYYLLLMLLLYHIYSVMTRDGRKMQNVLFAFFGVDLLYLHFFTFREYFWRKSIKYTNNSREEAFRKLKITDCLKRF